MRDLTVEQYHMVYPEWYGSAFREVSSKFHTITKGEEWTALQICLPSLLPNKWSYPYYSHYIAPHMSAHCSTRTHSPFKTVLGNIRDKYQAYCTMYKTHAMATHHGGAWCPLDRGIDLNIEDPYLTVIDNESTHGSDTPVALGGPEAEGHPNDPIYSNQDKLMVLTREINNLHQWVEARERQPAESLDCIEHELQNLLIVLHIPPPHTPN